MNNDNIENNDVKQSVQASNQSSEVSNSTVGVDNHVVGNPTVEVNRDNLNTSMFNSKTLLFIIIGVVLIVVVFVVFKPLDKLRIGLDNDKTNNNDGKDNVLNPIINSPESRTFVTMVHKYIDMAYTYFMMDAFSNQPEAVAYTNIENSDIRLPQYTMQTNETSYNYYIELDEDRNCKRVLMYDSNFCYDSGPVSSLEKTDVNIETIVLANKNDSYNGCVIKR